MGSQRSILIIALLVVSFFLYQQWLIRDASTTPGVDASSAPEPVHVVPEAFDDTATSTVPGQTAGDETLPASSDMQTGETIRVRTDVLDVEIDLRGGDLVDARLLEFAERQGEAERFHIMHRLPGHIYIAQSGLIGRDGTDTGQSRPIFEAAQDVYELGDGQTLRVPLRYTREDGTQVLKVYSFTRGDYAVNVAYEISNPTDNALRMAMYGQLKQTMVSDSGGMFMPTYRGSAYSTDDTRYDKYSFSNIENRDLNQNTIGGWVAMLEHYFVTAWVPGQTENNRIYTNATRTGDAMIGFVGPTLEIPAQGEGRIAGDLFLGPKDQSRLAELANNLDLTVDYGFMWWLAQPLFALMTFIHSLVGNWGVVIILITLIVKLILYPLTKAQYTSMAKMRMVAPKMKALKEKYGDDRQKMSQAMMKLYQEEKVNPLGGCLPMLLQLPIFLTLYWVLLESAEFRHADFMLWITDLSSRDPYFILPLLMGASMWLMQRLQPTPITDPMQKKLMQMMPILFTVFFLFFPAGLVLYWLVSNLISIAQMLWIYRQIEKKGLNSKKAKS